MFSRYLRGKITAGCKGIYIDSGCNPYKGTSLVNRLYRGWSDGRLEEKLRKQTGLEIRKNNLGTYEMVTIDSETEITLFNEPGVTITGGTSRSFTTKTRVRSARKLDGQIANVDGATGTLSSSSADFVTDGVVAGDMVVIDDGYVLTQGVYKVITRDDLNTLTLNTSDQIFTTQTSMAFTVYQSGMHLQQFVSTAKMNGGTTVSFVDSDPDTITRTTGNWEIDGFTDGMAITVSGAVNSGNNGTFIVDTVVNDVITLISSESLTAEAATSGTEITGVNGIVRTLNNVDYPFRWRMFGNGGTLAQCFQFVQRELRRTTDIDDGYRSSIGNTTDLLMSFASPTGVGINMYIDDLAAADSNNATFEDISGDSRNFAFIASVTINLNSNITTDTSAKVVVFFSDADDVAGNGDEFDTNGAIIVQDVNDVDMTDSTPLSTPLSFQFDYDNNAQGGRTPATDADVTIVCMGLDKAQYVQVTGTILRQNENIFSLVAALERNYSNP